MATRISHRTVGSLWTPQTIALGNSPSFTGNHHLNGLLDEVAVFTRALSLSEISSLYSASL